MSNDVKQPVAISFRDYRDEAIADFFANESRSFQSDIPAGLSNGRLRLVGSSHSESRPTAAFRTSINLAEGVKNIPANTITNSINDQPKKLKSTQKTITKSQKNFSYPKSNIQLKTTETIGASSLVNDCDSGLATATDEINNQIETAFSKPTRSIASLSKPTNLLNKTSISESEFESVVESDSLGVIDCDVDDQLKSESVINVGNLELPAVIAPVLQPVLQLRDRLDVLKKRATNENVLRAVTLQVADIQDTIESATRRDVDDYQYDNDNNNEFKNCRGLKIVSTNNSGKPDLHIVDIADQVDYTYLNQQNPNLNPIEFESDIMSDMESELRSEDCANTNNCYDNVKSSIKLDQNLQKLVKAWSWLSDQIKETIISVIIVAEKEKQATESLQNNNYNNS
jgi:hypothetical protein